MRRLREDGSLFRGSRSEEAPVSRLITRLAPHHPSRASSPVSRLITRLAPHHPWHLITSSPVASHHLITRGISSPHHPWHLITSSPVVRKPSSHVLSCKPSHATSVHSHGLSPRSHPSRFLPFCPSPCLGSGHPTCVSSMWIVREHTRQEMATTFSLSSILTVNSIWTR
jgi:hypothetical protein